MAYAATVGPNGTTSLPQYSSNEYLSDLEIEADSDGEITAEHGIHILFEPTYHVRWDKDIVTLSASGTAVDNGKVDATIVPEYFHDLGAVYIPIRSDLSAGEAFTLSGLRLRTYEKNIGTKVFDVDITGDKVSDFEAQYSYYVNESYGIKNFVGPYAPTDVDYSIVDGKAVLTWTNSIDWDLAETRIEKYTGSDDVYTVVSLNYGLVNSQNVSTFTDNYYNSDIDTKYVLAPIDDRNAVGDTVELILLSGLSPEPEPEVPVEEPEDEPEDVETEVEELERLMNYYNIRFSIKCMPSGVAVAENDSACLWARIDLIYAQVLTDSYLRDIALSDRDLELMATRRKWPELRYQDNCVDADEPASYCTSLGKALDRISYFLD